MKATQHSTWEEGASLPSFPALKEDTETEVAIIGGGITGLLSAYILAKRGHRVVVLEAGKLAQKATLFTTAFITQSIDTDFTDLVPMFGDAGAKRIWESHGAAIDLIQKIVTDEKIDCEFMRCPNISYANDSSEGRDLDAELVEMKRLGLKASPVTKPLSFRNRRAMLMANQAKYHPMKFLAGVVEALQKMGVEIYEKSEVKKIEGDGPFRVQTAKRTVTADWTVTSTYHPFNNPKEVTLKKGMYRTYLIELEAPAGKYTEGIYEDFDNPYHYFRVDAGKGKRGKDRIILGGEDHRIEIKMKEEKNLDALVDYAKDIFGKSYPIVRSWSGLIEEPIDGLALIGEYDPHQLIATAFSGNGMTYAGISALLFADIIEKKRDPYREIYEPGRTPSMTQLWKKGRDYTEELFRGAVANAFKDEK